MKYVLLPLLAGSLALAAPAYAEDLSPGLWEISVESRIPGMDFLRPPPNQTTQCLTAEDARDPSKLIGSISTPGAKDCTYTDKNYSKSAGTFKFAMSCAGSYELHTQGDVNFTATTLDGSITATGNLNGQPAEVQNRVSARRVGNC